MRVLPADPVDAADKQELVVSGGGAPLIVGMDPFEGEFGFSCPGCGEVLVERVDPQYYMRYVLEYPVCRQRYRVFLP